MSRPLTTFDAPGGAQAWLEFDWPKGAYEALTGLESRFRFILGRCECCGAADPTVVPAMTAYAWDGQGSDPNRDLSLCDQCRVDYQDHWNEMWREYYAGLL